MNQQQSDIVRMHYLYTFYDQNKEPLYVGRTVDKATRLRTHQRKKEWFKEVTSIEWQELGYLTDYQAELKEARIIKRTRPKYNVKHNKKDTEVVQIDTAINNTIQKMQKHWQISACYTLGAYDDHNDNIHVDKLPRELQSIPTFIVEMYKHVRNNKDTIYHMPTLLDDYLSREYAPYGLEVFHLIDRFFLDDIYTICEDILESSPDVTVEFFKADWLISDPRIKCVDILQEEEEEQWVWHDFVYHVDTFKNKWPMTIQMK